jgi:hypothetical protein
MASQIPCNGEAEPRALNISYVAFRTIELCPSSPAPLTNIKQILVLQKTEEEHRNLRKPLISSARQPTAHGQKVGYLNEYGNYVMGWPIDESGFNFGQLKDIFLFHIELRKVMGPSQPKTE